MVGKEKSLSFKPIHAVCIAFMQNWCVGFDLSEDCLKITFDPIVTSLFWSGTWNQQMFPMEFGPVLHTRLITNHGGHIFQLIWSETAAGDQRATSRQHMRSNDKASSHVMAIHLSNLKTKRAKSMHPGSFQASRLIIAFGPTLTVFLPCCFKFTLRF